MAQNIRFTYIIRFNEFGLWCSDHNDKIRVLYPNYTRIFFFFCVMSNWMPNYSVDRTLTELNPNNSLILRTFSEFSEFFPNFFGLFFLFCRTKISDPDNSKLFPNHEFLISPNRTRIIHLSLCSVLNSLRTSILSITVKDSLNFTVWG